MSHNAGQGHPAFARPPVEPMVRDASVLGELIMNFGGPECTAHIQDGKVHDQTEFYTSVCALFGISPNTDAYVEVITITNATAFVSEFVRQHRRDLVALGWLKG